MELIETEEGIYVIKIDDSFVEVKYKLTGSSEYSIQDLIDVITKNTKLTARRLFQGDKKWK